MGRNKIIIPIFLVALLFLSIVLSQEIIKVSKELNPYSGKIEKSGNTLVFISNKTEISTYNIVTNITSIIPVPENIIEVSNVKIKGNNIVYMAIYREGYREITKYNLLTSKTSIMVPVSQANQNFVLTDYNYLLVYIDCQDYNTKYQFCFENVLKKNPTGSTGVLFDLTLDGDFPSSTLVAFCNVGREEINNLDGLLLKRIFSPSDPKLPTQCRVCNILTGEVIFDNNSRCSIKENAEAEFKVEYSPPRTEESIVTQPNTPKTEPIAQVSNKASQPVTKPEEDSSMGTFILFILILLTYLGIKHWKKTKQEQRRQQEEVARRKTVEQKRKFIEEQRRIREKEEKISAAQKAKGLVKFKDKWVTPTEYKKLEKEAYEQSFPSKVESEIKKFKPSRNWATEEGYQGELQGWLRHQFPHSRVEIQKGKSRPDILIGDVAIEVKGPTGSAELASIADKCMRYGLHFEHFIVVLFNLKVNHYMYQEWKEALKKQYPNVKLIVISNSYNLE
jgi:hypothetical protein